MNLEQLKSKTVWASVLLLVLSVVRFANGDVSAVQGIQEAVMSLVPIFLRMAVGNATEAARDAASAAQDAAQAVDQVKAAAVRQKPASEAPAMPAAGEW